MEHLEYEDYAGRGGSADEASFAMLEARASRIVDAMTHGRLAQERPLRETVKCCLTQLIDAMAADAMMDGGSGREVAAVSNDGVSVSYASGATGGAAARNARIVRGWLDGEVSDRGVNLLYAGVDR